MLVNPQPCPQEIDQGPRPGVRPQREHGGIKPKGLWLHSPGQCTAPRIASVQSHRRSKTAHHDPTDQNRHLTSLAQKFVARRFAMLSVLCPIPLAAMCVALTGVEPGSREALLIMAVTLPPLASSLLGVLSHLRRERALKWVGIGLLLSLVPLAWALYLLTHLQVGF